MKHALYPALVRRVAATALAFDVALDRLDESDYAGHPPVTVYYRLKKYTVRPTPLMRRIVHLTLAWAGGAGPSIGSAWNLSMLAGGVADGMFDSARDKATRHAARAASELMHVVSGDRYIAEDSLNDTREQHAAVARYADDAYADVASLLKALGVRQPFAVLEATVADAVRKLEASA